MLPDEVREAVEYLDDLILNYHNFDLLKWQTIRAHLLAREAEVERLQDSVNSLGLESAEHFVRGREWAERCGKQEARAERAEAMLRDVLDSYCASPGLHKRITDHLSENSRDHG